MIIFNYLITSPFSWKVVRRRSHRRDRNYALTFSRGAFPSDGAAASWACRWVKNPSIFFSLIHGISCDLFFFFWCQFWLLLGLFVHFLWWVFRGGSFKHRDRLIQNTILFFRLIEAYQLLSLSAWLSAELWINHQLMKDDSNGAEAPTWSQWSG